MQQHLDQGDALGRAYTGNKLSTLVASALAGGDCIVDDAVLRTGGTACTARLRAQGDIHPGNLPAQFPADRSLSQGRPLLMDVRGVSPTSVISWPEARKQPNFQAALSSASGVVSHPAARRACSRSKAERME